MALPLPLRNRLAELILDSLHDPRARNTLSALVRFCGEPEDATAPPELVVEFPAALGKEHHRFRKEFCERTLRAWDAVRDRSLAGREPALAEALKQAADLFDARLFFEVHELLEPYWVSAEGATREALQGLIQIAVGFEHLANDNVDGARMLLEEGSSKVEGKQLEGMDLSDFARAVRLGVLPRFPRGG